MATIYATRAQMIIAGAPVRSFLVDQESILSIYVKYTLINSPVPGLNYTPTAIGVVPSIKQVDLVFEYAYTNDQALFDFSQLPTDLVNIQFLLFSETNQPLCLVSNIFFRGSNLNYPDISTHAARSVVLGGLDITYFGV